AVEVVFAGSDPVPTMVFDEVDSGVGGQAAAEVGRRLAVLARDHQGIVVTHLPQVAPYADRPLVVDKDRSGAGTRRGGRGGAENERARERARMLAGLADSELGQAHAEELLATAAEHKRVAPTTKKKAAAKSDSGPGKSTRRTSDQAPRTSIDAGSRKQPEPK